MIRSESEIGHTFLNSMCEKSGTMEKENNKAYIAIDLKSFYASVECVKRGLDPLNTHLVVADTSRTEDNMSRGLPITEVLRNWRTMPSV